MSDSLEPLESAASAPEAVFIVGVSRSGTTLMREALERSSSIAISTENHFLGHLVRRWGMRYVIRRLGDPAADATLRTFVDQLYSGELQRRSWFRELSPYWRWLVRTVDRAEVERRLLASDRSDRGLFVAFLQLYSDAHNKDLIGEKTPAHLNYADELLTWFPGGRIVHMLRDPRGVYVSELRRRTARAESVPYRQLKHVASLFALFVLLQVTVAWAGAITRHRRLEPRYPGRYRVVRFEDLVREPQPTLRGLFDFLGLEMEPAILRARVVSRGVKQGELGWDAGAADRWREMISPRAERWLRLVLGSRMRAMGYRD